jgi:acyl-coenzyme A synthetase/AMP-(fatty) acid ligase
MLRFARRPRIGLVCTENEHEFSLFKYPHWIKFATELPKTATGKIQRFKLRG